MAQLYHWVCFLFICLLLSVASKTEAAINVTLTVIVESAISKGAVCTDGSAPGYYYDKGHGEGVANWVIFLEGGGWCLDAQNCKNRVMGNLWSSKYMFLVHELGNLLSENPNENLDFYNWNRVYVAYCDGSSYTSDANEVDRATNLTYRGAKVFYALMEDFKAKGMGMAKNAIFSGNSAGGVAMILHCDHFRALLPSTIRIKYLADSSYFIDDKK
ncbi:PREDICTED: pectin acetylesterase 8-like [Ipomoea nil]|uniref:pectin acetylesterase 8-like n=1 Tax=Ipomoea nil TaxID=35883 RepID=UPI000900D2FB|nr:PREDICTED: pectin acetylesterase 8-like [Ipomoea nil]